MNKIAIFGPPGTGKTHRLVKLIKEEVDFGTRPAVYLSFTKSAAKEALSRLGPGHRVRASTVHALAYGVLGVNRESVIDGKKLSEFGRKTGWQFKADIKGVSSRWATCSCRRTPCRAIPAWSRWKRSTGWAHPVHATGSCGS